MSRYPTLDKGEFVSGRQFRKAFIDTARRRDHGLPVGTAALLETSLLRAQAHWDKYEAHVTEYGLCRLSSAKKADEGVISAFAWSFRPAVTHLTLAAELVDEFHWVLRVQYSPQDGETLSKEERRFANLGNQALNLMARVVDHLTAAPPNPRKTCKSEVEEMYYFLLDYALHLGNLGVKVCEPENYAFHHPKAAEWRDRMARAQEAYAESFRWQAKQNRNKAKALRGQPVPTEVEDEVVTVQDENPPRRFLYFFPAGSDFYDNCVEKELPVHCDIVDLGEGTVTALNADGGSEVVTISNYDVIYIDTDMMDAAHGRERRQEIIEHIRKHNVRVEEVFAVQLIAGPLVDGYQPEPAEEDESDTE